MYVARGSGGERGVAAGVGADGGAWLVAGMWLVVGRVVGVLVAVVKYAENTMQIMFSLCIRMLKRCWMVSGGVEVESDKEEEGFMLMEC